MDSPAPGGVGVETYIAAAGLGLFVMFAAEMATVYTYMLDPALEFFEPEPKLLQFISIGAAPASIMAAVSHIMSRRYGSRRVGAMTAAGGAAMLAGVAYAAQIAPGIPEGMLTPAVAAAPYVFAAVSLPVMASGMLLFRTRPRRAKKGYV